jgi:hypothetical protein
MGKQKRTSIIRYGSLLAVMLLTGCSTSTSSASPSKPVAIRYIDDSAAGTEIGYSYVASGKSALLPVNYEDTTWDWSSRSGDTTGFAPGDYWAFKDFEGVYDDGTAVDLSKVTADCTVKATFIKKRYQWSFTYWNGGLHKAALDTTLDFDGATFPTFPSDLKVTVDENPDWYQDSHFTGFSFEKDTATTKNVFKDSSLLRFESGDADPSSSSVSAAGTIYYSLALTNQNRHYPCWLSTGSEWVSLGSLKAGLQVRLNSAYTKTLKNFTMSFYPSASDAKAGTNKRSESLSFVYGSTLTIDASDPANVKFSALAGGASVPQELTLTYTGTSVVWQGIFTGADGLDQATDRYYYKNSGEVLKDQSQLFENCAFYPV